MQLLSRLVFSSCFGISIVLFAPPTCHAVQANPRAFHATQPFGKIITPQLFIRGDEHFSFLSDRKGFTVVKDENDWLVYAKVEERKTAEGVYNCLAPSNLPVGMIDPLNEKKTLRKKATAEVQKSARIPKLLATESNRYEHCALLQGNLSLHQSAETQTMNHFKPINTLFSVEAAEHHNKNATQRYLQSPMIRTKLAKGTLKHLVVLIRFADHVNRTLPEPKEYEIILNQRGGDPILAPTGSVRDAYLEISYNQLSVESVIYKDWITLSKTEEYYADLMYGTGAKFNEAISEAMGTIDWDDTFSLKQFDKDEDGIIDVITFFHSGYGAENGGIDCETRADKSVRVWSHFRDKQGISWCSSNIRNSKLCVAPVIVATGLWGTCSSSICHIGTVAHEIGHFLGLKDMYDGDGQGAGVGCYSIMASVWGFDISQKHPPPMDPWSKIKLGWISPVVLNVSGVYNMEASFFKGLTYKVQEGYPVGEYLLIENLQPLGFNTDLPQGGLAIWHIDEKASYQSDGYPGQKGWPRNGNHYIVALLQADGKYDLERGKGCGDSGDLWHAGSRMKTLGPSKSLSRGPFPNTDSYQGGVLQQTGISIRDISISGKNMSFTLVLPGEPLPSQQSESLPKKDELPTATKTPTKFQPGKNLSAESESENFVFHPLESVFTSIAEFNLTFTPNENIDFEKFLTYTEEYLDKTLAGYFKAQNIPYRGIDLQISDWSFSVLPSYTVVHNYSKPGQELTSGTSLVAAIVFYGELELTQKISVIQKDAINTRILMSLNGKQELKEANSFASFLLASNDTVVLGIQNITATLIVRNINRGRGSGTPVNAINSGGTWHQRHNNMAGIAMMATILVLFVLVGGIYLFRSHELQKTITLTNSKSLTPFITTDSVKTGDLCYREIELTESISCQPSLSLYCSDTPDLDVCCTLQACSTDHSHYESISSQPSSSLFQCNTSDLDVCCTLQACPQDHIHFEKLHP